MTEIVPPPSAARRRIVLFARVRPGRMLRTDVVLRVRCSGRILRSPAAPPFTNETLVETATASAGTPQEPPVIVKSRRTEGASAEGGGVRTRGVAGVQDAARGERVEATRRRSREDELEDEDVLASVGGPAVGRIARIEVGRPLEAADRVEGAGAPSIATWSAKSSLTPPQLFTHRRLPSALNELRNATK